MRKYFNIILAVTLIIAGFTACEYSQDVEPVMSPDGYPKFTFTPAEEYSNVKEGDTLYFTFTTDKMIDRAMTFRAKVVGGEANDEDFTVAPAIIAPYSTSSELQLIIPQDWDAEPLESASIEFGLFSIAEKYMLHPSTTNPVVNLSIENYVSDMLTVTIGWGQTITGIEVVAGETELPSGAVIEWIDTVAVEYEAGSYMDFDILISPADIFDPADPWASEIGNYSGASANNPEVVEAILEDGEYILWTDLWYNELYDPEVHEFLSYDDSTLTVPMSANFVRQGTPLNLDIDLAEPNIPLVFQPGALLSYSPSVYTGFAFNGVIAKIVVADGVYKIVNYDDDSELGAARKSAKSRTPRPASLRK